MEPKVLSNFDFTDLVPHGDHRLVNVENLEEFIFMKKEKKMVKDILVQSKNIAKGMADVLGRVGLGIFSFKELEELIRGPSVVTPDMVLSGIRFRGGSDRQPAQFTPSQWFLDIVGSMTEEQLRKLLFFATAAELPPADTSQKWLKVTFDSADDADHLPTAHTCMNEIVLPIYNSIDAMRQKLNMAAFESEPIANH
jgi:hypothetical protein